MTKREYAREREKQATKARAEFMEVVRADGKLQKYVSQTMRAIDYIVKRMGINSVITDQMGSVLLGHMQCFARSEVRLSAKTAKKGRR